jgi:hypothetical protein
MTISKQLNDKYGVIMKLSEVAEVIKLKPNSIRNMRALDKFPIPTHSVRNRIYCMTEDVVKYLDRS